MLRRLYNLKIPLWLLKFYPVRDKISVEKIIPPTPHPVRDATHGIQCSIPTACYGFGKHFFYQKDIPNGIITQKMRNTNRTINN